MKMLIAAELPLSFFYDGHGTRRDLHSFPTRRSSDLCLAVSYSRMGRPHTTIGATAFHFRSEEHTSELQSRFAIVCRLLLEKTKLVPTRPSERPRCMMP